MSIRHLQLRPTRPADERGFTLIELLVVVVIIGVLIAIAIPVYLNYEKGAKDKSAESDLHNAIGVLELCNSDNGVYPTGLTGGTTLTGCTQKLTVSGGTTVTYANAPATASYMLHASNSGGKPTYYCYNSLNGGAIKTVATAATAC